MKKLAVIANVILVLVLAACSEQETLYVLNWGDYMNMDLVAAFEEEFNVRVVYEEVDSNESMYERISAGNTDYDIAIPSDYMVEKLKNENLILQLDPGQLLDAAFYPTVSDVTTEAGIDGWASPYFFGSLGIMYRLEMQEVVEQYGFEALFNRAILPMGARVGMYNASRDAVASALLYLGYSVNTTSDAELAEAEAALAGMDYEIFGDDQLKNLIAQGNLDVALTYSGDFFDTLYVALEEETDVDFGFYSPLSNNLWVDYMVIPSTTQNESLAYEFINFFRDVDNAYENHSYVGYAPTMPAVYDIVKEDPDMEDIISIPAFLDQLISADFEGQIYRDLGNDYKQKLEEILNRVKQ